MRKIKFSDLININELKTMTENLYNAVGIPVGIFDVDGTGYVEAGWCESCTKYHRVNPISFGRCLESDKYIKEHLSDGSYVAYKCKNNMRDIVVPIIIFGEHLATVFVGQFFYEDEIIDEELFRKQAREFGFDEDEYIESLRRTPVFPREKVKYIMEYYTGLVKTLAESGYRLLKYKSSEEKLEKNQKYFKLILDSVNKNTLLLLLKIQE